MAIAFTQTSFVLRDFCTTPLFVTPAKAGVQKVLKRLDTGFRRYDDLPRFRRNSKVSLRLSKDEWFNRPPFDCPAGSQLRANG